MRRDAFGHALGDAEQIERFKEHYNQSATDSPYDSMLDLAVDHDLRGAIYLHHQAGHRGGEFPLLKKMVSKELNPSELIGNWYRLEHKQKPLAKTWLFHQGAAAIPALIGGFRDEDFLNFNLNFTSCARLQALWLLALLAKSNFRLLATA